MIMTVVINSIFAFAFIICLLFTLGNLETATASAAGYPIIEVYYEATKSKAGTNIMVVMLSWLSRSRVSASSHLYLD
jgi:choline transport protein